MTYARALRCRKCGREYDLAPLNLCDFCFSPLEVTYDYKAISEGISREKIAGGPPTMWRYQCLLPVDDNIVDLGTGLTPLVHAANLAREVGLDELYIKNDCLNPTYSFKDRVVSVAISKAREFGFDTIACASTGNLAASVAAHAAKTRLRSFVFVPADTEPSKILGTSVYSPTVMAIEGSYDDVNRLCNELARKYNWGFININLRPYYAEGSKTLAFEIVEQLGWRAPDCIVAPGGSGLLFTRIWKGLEEFAMLRLIEPVNTHMHLAQAAGSSPIVNAFRAGSLHVNPVKPDTIAKSIAIGNPADGYYALKAARESGGSGCAVSDAEVIQGIKLLAETEGIFAETAGGVVIAALRQLTASGVIRRQDRVVAVITAAGFKTPDVLLDTFTCFRIQPTLASFEEVLAQEAAVSS
ncbi:MAG: threonine synthase [Dehalococcoidia bacterium]|nr:threonine synthase [Dehalococcoidia bacterium]